jgi:broad specificity phosphatase PhoE
MTVPHALLSSWVSVRAARRRAALLVRHAERGPVHDLRTHEQVLLTARGHIHARAAGASLAAPLASSPAPVMRLLHSPVPRCRETAEGIAAGAADVGVGTEVAGVRAVLGTPFVRDPEAVWAMVARQGPSFMRAWFDGALSPSVLEPKESAAWAQIGAAQAELVASDAPLVVLVTHDWNLALVREALLQVRYEDAWPGYLDGVLLIADGDGWWLESAGRRVRLPERRIEEQLA